jgi:hypothetical protein
MAWNGSILFKLTWKERVTPSGRSIPALRARAWTLPKASKGKKQSNGFEGPFYLVPIPSSPPSYVILPSGLAQTSAAALHTSGSVCTGWPTPTKGNADGSQIAKDASPTGKRPDGSKATVSLNQVAVLASWPTPMAGTKATETYNEAGNTDSGRKTVALAHGAVPLASWPTPNAHDGSGGGQAKRVGGSHSQQLNDYAMLAPWCSPSARDWKDTPGMATTGTNPDGSQRNRMDQLPRQVLLAQPGSSARTEKPGQLNPAFSLSLMIGEDQAAWLSCAPPATRSRKRKRSSSSAPCEGHDA